jgi:hypothetical protein
MAGKGGQDPNLRELVLTGPFKGMSPDSSNWYIGPPGYFISSENVDYLKGEVATRAGSSYVLNESDLDTIAGSITIGQGSALGSIYPPNFKKTIGATTYTQKALADGLMVRQGEPGFLYGEYGTWYSKLSGDSSTMYSLRFPKDSATYWLKTNLGFGFAYYSPSTTVNTAAKTVTWVSGDDFTDVCPLGMYFATETNKGTTSEWYRVLNATATTMTLDRDVTAGENGVAFHLIPVLSGKNMISTGIASPGTKIGKYATATYIPPIGGWYVGGWLHGGLIYVNGTSSSSSTNLVVGRKNNKTAYSVRASAYYNNRLVLACPQSLTYTSAWTLDNHPSRIVYSKNGDYFNLNPTDGIGAGAFDSDLGKVIDLFVMRDTLYGLCLYGIIAIQKTGNSTMPFRQQTVLRTNTITDTRAEVVDESFAIVSTLAGPKKFDGTSLQDMSPGVDEIFRGHVVDFVRYDPFRKRVFFWVSQIGVSFPSTAKNIYVYDFTSSAWSKWIYTDPTGTNAAPERDANAWCSFSSAEEQDEELVAWTTMGDTINASASPYGLVSYARSKCSDSTTVIPMAFQTAVLDADKSRDIRTATRIRVTVAKPITAQYTIYADIYTDGGTAPALTIALDQPSLTGSAIQHLYKTFAGVSGQQWSVKIRVSSNAERARVYQVALSFVDRQEKKPN